MPNITEKLTRLRGSAMTPPWRPASRGREEGTAKAQQELAEHQLIRARQVVGLAVPARRQSSSTRGGDNRPCQFGRLMVGQLVTIRQTSRQIWTTRGASSARFCNPTYCSQPMTRCFCSASTMRISSISTQGAILPLDSQRVFSNGLLRCPCSNTMAETIWHQRAPATSRSTALQTRSRRPSDSTAHNSAMPSASKKVIKSFLKRPYAESPAAVSAQSRTPAR